MGQTQHDQLLTLLAREQRWVPARDLAAALGVSSRSIRSYVSALNTRVDGEIAVESGAQGYRAGPAAVTAMREDVGRIPSTPKSRLRALIRMLLDAPSGIDAHRSADGFHVSDATFEADLVKLRKLLASYSLSIMRRGSCIELVGSEVAKRQLFTWVVREECAAVGEPTAERLREVFAPDSPGHRVFGPFRAALEEHLGRSGYVLNELSAADTLLHVAIVAERAVRSAPLDVIRVESMTADGHEMAEMLGALAVRHLGVHLAVNDSRRLASVLLTRVMVISPSDGQTPSLTLDPRVEKTVRGLLAASAEEFRVDIVDEELVRRLSRHVQVLRERARLGAWSQNSLTRSLKASYPLVFDIAVAIAAGIKTQLDMTIPDDEIAFIAMHLGAFLEKNKWDEPRLTAVIVCPGYPDTRELLQASVERTLGNVLDVVDVRGAAEPRGHGADPDLILTTSDLVSTKETVVRIQPFLTDADVDRIHVTASRIRRSRRLGRLRDELERYFHPTAFLPDVTGLSTDQVIGKLGGLLVADGVVGEDYVQRAIERERLSSTAFIDAVAIPHAIGTGANRTSIAVGIADPSIAWGESRVQIVMLVAFSQSDRSAFQTVFEQLVEVFSGRDSIARMAGRATSFTAFLDELVSLIDG